MSVFIEKFTYVWEIKNPEYCTTPTRKFIDSPKFHVPQFCNSKWFLRLYPCGDRARRDKITSCFMHRGHDSGPDIIEIKNTLNLSSRKRSNSTKYGFEKNCRGWGYPTFLPNALNTYKDSIVIIWEMQFELHSLDTPEIKYHSSRNYRPLSTNCFAQTKILYETKSIQRSIDSMVDGTCTKISIPLNLQENYPSLIMSLQSNSTDKIYFNLGLTNAEFEDSLMMICEFSMENNVGQLLYSFGDKHKFVRGTEEVWRLAKSISKSHFQTHLSGSSLNQIHLKGDFSFSTGEALSEIVSMERMKSLRDFVTGNESMLSIELFRLCKEKKLCDFTLKVGQETFEVHKVVLAAVSPVFAAMLTNEMAEKENSVVDIVDVDKETVEDMVYFMYNGYVRELEYESAKKLYSAGDKYEIFMLLDFTRKVLIDLINSNTICDILCVADSHSDHKLLKEAMKFFKLNKTAILSSSKWEAFIMENANLAIKTLTEVCLLNKRKRIQ